MFHPISQTRHLRYPEVVIADLSHFRIAVLTTTQQVKRKLSSFEIPVFIRSYQTQGWIIFKERVVASFDKLALGNINANNSSFASIRRLGAAVPVSFEVSSAQPLPSQLSTCASFSCTVPDTEFPYLSLFHRMLPRFVAIYPFTLGDSLVNKAKQMELDMYQFVQQNAHRLQQVPFYKDSFDL
ncbi:MAG: hypothetical protein AAGG02_03845 [Cyanobacteria bacterium P01_H01_bin.15]